MTPTGQSDRELEAATACEACEKNGVGFLSGYAHIRPSVYAYVCIFINASICICFVSMTACLSVHICLVFSVFFLQNYVLFVSSCTCNRQCSCCCHRLKLLLLNII